MTEAGIFGKSLMGQRPDSKNDSDLDDLDYYIYSGIDSSAGDESEDKSDVNINEGATDEEIPTDGVDILEVVNDGDVELYHNENINPDGSIKEFNLYDGELPLDLEVGTSTAAKSLGCTEQTIRNYCNDFQEFLDIRVVNGRRKLTIKTLRKLDVIMRIKEERKYDREQMKAYLRHEGKESLIVTEEERLKLLSEMVSKRVIGDLLDKFKEDGGLLSLLSEQMIDVINEKISLDREKLKIDEMSEQIQSSFDKLIKKEDEIKGLMDQLSLQKESENENDRLRLKKLEEQLEASRKEVSEYAAASEKKDEEIARLQSDIEQLRESSNKKRKFPFFR